MDGKTVYTWAERRQTATLAKELRELSRDTLFDGDEQRLRHHVFDALRDNKIHRNIFGLNTIVLSLQTAIIAVTETGLKRDGIIAVLLHACVGDESDGESEASLREEFGDGVAKIIRGLAKVHRLYSRHPVVESENFRNLLLSFAEDMRVILIGIADRVCLMRRIRDTDNHEAQAIVSQEAAYLYAPLAHKLGLYRLKSELEDLSLKYLEHEAYYMIKGKLNETKKSRDAYIDKFITPIERSLADAGLNCHIKGRTKSIHSIWQKMKKQKCGFEGIYDLFAIRIILDSPLEKEKAQCWQVYSIITDMYQPNPKRLRDWLSVPKSNGYESLHITVLGPESKWVEVQIRTERMDEIAERGFAAHWRYKGVKDGGDGLDEWLNDMRTALENSDNAQAINDFRMELYEDEVFVFTPKGDLIKFPKGATVLDFAYHIHSKIGNGCTGARINNKIVSIKHVLRSGDQVEIITSNSQKPHSEWLNIVKTSRAKSKIRLALKETQAKDGVFAKEMLERRLRNRKIEYSESIMSQVVKKLGFKETRDFYKQLADGSLGLNTVIERYQELREKELNMLQAGPARSAGEYSYDNPNEGIAAADDVLVIDSNVKGVDCQPAKCCRPIYGDEVFGFVTVSGGIKIHRTDCPNAAELRRRFAYRIVKAKWSGKGTSQYSAVLRIIGNDDIGIVNNITSIISKEEKIMMRSINIDSNDGLFSGNLTVNVEDLSRLERLIKKLRTVKGVKQVTRI